MECGGGTMGGTPQSSAYPTMVPEAKTVLMCSACFPFFWTHFLKNLVCRTYLHKQCRVQPVFPFLASFHKNLRICTNCIQCHKNSQLAASLCVKLTRCFINFIYCFKSFQKKHLSAKNISKFDKKNCHRQILGIS